jgi:hypothetical protein
MQSMRFWSICGLLPNSYRQGSGSCHAILLIWDNHPSFKKALLKCPNVMDVPNSRMVPRTQRKLPFCGKLRYYVISGLIGCEALPGGKEQFVNRHSSCVSGVIYRNNRQLGIRVELSNILDFGHSIFGLVSYFDIRICG